MFSDKTFKFYIRNYDNPNLWYRVDGKNVYQSNTKEDIGDCLSNWRDITILFKRSTDWWGVFREFTEGTMTFVLKGALILKDIFAQHKSIGKAKFIIEKLNTTNTLYYPFYEGDISFENTTTTDISIDVDIKEAGLIGLLKNRQDVEYEIPLDDPLAVTGRMTGLLLRSKSFWIPGNSNSNENGTAYMTMTPFDTQQVLFPVQYSGLSVQAGSFILPTNQEASNINSVYYTNTAAISSSFVQNYINKEKSSYLVPFAETLEDFHNVNIIGNIRFDVNIVQGNPGHVGEINFRILEIDISDPTQQTIHFIGGTGNITSDLWHNINLSINHTIPFIPKGKLLYLTFRHTNNYGLGPLTNVRIFISSILNIFYSAKIPQSTYKAFRYKDLWQRLIEKITDNEYIGASNFLSNTNSSTVTYRDNNFDNSPYNTLVTSGNSLRGIPDSSIKITLRDLLKDVFVQWNCGIYKEGAVIFIEPLKDIFNSTNILELGEVANVSVSNFGDKMFNLLKIGQRAYDNNNTVGKNEFNTTISFLAKAVNNTETKELDMVSPFRRDVYGIESIRAETFEEDRKDNRFDNDTFCIEVDPTPVSGEYLAYKPLGIIGGVDDPDNVYNVTMSPKRAFYRNFGFIKSIVDEGLLEYQTIDKNPDLYSLLHSSMAPVWFLVETVSVLASDAGFPADSYGIVPTRALLPKLFEPLIIEFDAVIPYNLNETLSGLSLRGYITFSYKGNQYKGFVMEIASKPATREQYRVSVLCHLDNDIKKLM